MKKVLLLFLVALISCSPQSKISYVNDYASVLTQEERNELAMLYKDHEEKTTNQILLVTTNDLGKESSVKDYAVSFGKNYGIGQKGKDNGVIIALDMSNRDIFIATGYGIEKVLEDQEVKAIIDSTIIPQFKEGKYYEGLSKGSREIIKHLELPENIVH